MQIQNQSLNQLIAAHQAAGAGIAANILHLTRFHDKIVLGTTDTPGNEDSWAWDYRWEAFEGETTAVACGAVLAGHLAVSHIDSQCKLGSPPLNTSDPGTGQPLRMPLGCDFMRQLPGEIPSHSPALYSHLAVLIPLFREAIHRLAAKICDHFELTLADVEAAVTETLNQIADGPARSRLIISRERGWQAPPGTVKVARPSKWGNPFQIGMKPDRPSKAEAVAKFQEELLRGGLKDRDQQTLLSKLPLLKGKRLACWCKSGVPCHADVLSKFAAQLP